MYLLHSIFIPTSRKVTIDDNGKKSYTKHDKRTWYDDIYVIRIPVT